MSAQSKAKRILLNYEELNDKAREKWGSNFCDLTRGEQLQISRIVVKKKLYFKVD